MVKKRKGPIIPYFGRYRRGISLIIVRIRSVHEGRESRTWVI